MASLIDIIRETSRQAITGDTDYASLEPYYFVLRGPAGKASLGAPDATSFFGAGGSSATFPLPLNPSSLTYTLPFSAEVTPLQQGGAISEEDGIHIGNIVIEATTGFRLKPIRDTSVGGSDGEFTGELGKRGFAGQGNLVSGQMHFWRLANRCFDAYSQLKKDPQTAPFTAMEFHSVRDDLHLMVVPKEFVLTREPSKNRVTYGYRVTMEIVGAAGALLVVSPDDDILTKIKNAISSIRKGIQAVAATIDDVTAALDEISRVISSVAGFIDDVKGVLDSFEDLVAGTVNFVATPKRFITSLADTAEALADAAAAVASWPADVAQAFRGVGDELDRLVVAGQNFWVEDWRAKADKYNERLQSVVINSSTYASGGSADIASLGTPGTGATTRKVSDVFSGGTRDEKPGDARRALVAQNQNRLAATAYNGFEEKVVGAGDTLPGLAAKHLKRADRWMDLAVVNDLKPPFITAGAKIPNTLTVGSKIVIPIATATAGQDVLTEGQATVGMSQAEKALGEDFYMTQQKNAAGQLINSFGWRIDTRGGSVDVMKIGGVPNYGQALEMRFRTIQGENILYPDIGLSRIVGQNNFGDKLVSAEYIGHRQLLADKRTGRVIRFSFEVSEDTVTMDAEIQPVGFDGSRTIQRTLT